MDNHAPKALYIIASIAVAGLIISIVWTIVSFTNKQSSDQMNAISNLTSQMDETQYTKYDGEIVNGSQVMAIIKQFQNNELAIRVDTGGSTHTIYIYPDSTFDPNNSTCSISGDRMDATEFATAMRLAKTRSEAAYIAPSANFICTVCRNPDTKGITGLYFNLQ